MKAAFPDDIAQRVAADVAVGRGIGHFADTNAVQNDPDYAREHKFEPNRLAQPALWDGPQARRGRSALVETARVRSWTLGSAGAGTFVNPEAAHIRNSTASAEVLNRADHYSRRVCLHPLLFSTSRLHSARGCKAIRSFQKNFWD